MDKQFSHFAYPRQLLHCFSGAFTHLKNAPVELRRCQTKFIGEHYDHKNILVIFAGIACEQALQGALAAGREEEGELAITSLEFEYLHRKSPREMLIGGDDISNDVITLGACFSMFVYICAHFHFVLIGRNLTAQSMGSHRGIGGGIQIPET